MVFSLPVSLELTFAFVFPLVAVFAKVKLFLIDCVICTLSGFFILGNSEYRFQQYGMVFQKWWPRNC
jgi:hypothetical protein